ncbi:MAG: hypothetical protein Q8O52_13095 [Sulfuritalea sp.]|nr:hypothetical protein [Sulfuritalea sp.]
MRYWLPALVAFFCTGSAFALGLGEVEGRATIGRPLQIAIAILGSVDDAVPGACAKLLREGEVEGQDNIRIEVEGDRIHLTTSRALTQPILQFRIRLGCSAPIERSFTVLADPPQSAGTLPAVVAAPPIAAQLVRPFALPRVAPVASGEHSTVLTSATTLRLLSRQRYPGNSRLRVSFIRKVAAANPDLFVSEAAAFDQRLADGTRLLLPAELPAPQRVSGTPGAKPGSRAAAPPRASSAPLASGGRAQAAGGGRGRLIVGAAGLSTKGGPSTAELNESIDRLIEVMNQQVMVQMALTERIKAAEADVVELKRQMQAEKLRTAQLEAELKAAREQVERGDTIQLVLLILLAGFAGAWVLNWTSRRKAAPAVLPPLAAVAPAPTPGTRRRPQAMPSAFDDLPDARDDILPPGGLR